ncbi:MAG: HipA domain-containing protein, partial [Xanthomonadales bacterium]|nr:HipA domain-containing protein [Xanthomonadales bacterium]
AWLAQQSPAINEISATEKLLYVGQRGMGALEYQPARDISPAVPGGGLELASLVSQARSVIRGELEARIPDIMAAASSAGGMRAKALIGWNRQSNEVVANQAKLPSGFEAWILKLDGTGDEGKPQHWCRLEYAYHLMAQAAGLQMSESTLIRHDGLAHFATRRFDRDGGRKIHMHSLCGMRHADFNQPDVWSYEMYLQTCLKLGLGMDELAQAFRRMVFNVVARNQDDHTKNLAFLLDEGSPDWRLAPAFDITYAHGAGFTRTHQMSINGKFEHIQLTDIEEVANTFGIRKWETILTEVQEVVENWPEFAHRAGLVGEMVARVGQDHRFIGHTS